MKQTLTILGLLLLPQACTTTPAPKAADVIGLQRATPVLR
jgi:hypothetical protein